LTEKLRQIANSTDREFALDWGGATCALHAGL
jgi:hypothetical protein